MKIDILFCAWNRLEMTSATWSWMMAHTNIDLVNRVIAYDDGSEDGTMEFLRDQIEPLQDRRRPPYFELRLSNFGSPPAIMNHYVATSEAEVFAKIDNDIALPGGWLEKMSHVLSQHPEIDLLGMEAGMVALQGRDGKVYGQPTIERCTNIGGVGLMRVEAFRSRPPIPYRGRFGFTEWQERYDVPRAWIVPDIHCPQLDRLPFEPWVSISDEYIEKGWSRPWGKYDETWMAPYWEWMYDDAS